jgi:hypothetical protein
MVAMGLVLLAYLPQLPDITAFRQQWSAASPTSVGYLSQVYGMYLGDGWTVPITFALLAAGTWAMIRTGPLYRAGVLLIIVLYIGMMSLAGVSHYAAAFARFSIALLPLILVVIAEGILVFRKPIAIAAFVAITAATQGEIRSLFSAKASAPWNKVAEYVLQQSNIEGVVPLGGSVVAAMSSNSPRSIAFRLPSQLPTVGASPLRVLVVDEQSVLQPRGKRESFGDIQVIEYTGESARDISEQILSDLDQALGGKPNGQRNSYDLAGFELALALGHADAYTLWRERYWNSYARSPAARNAPSHMTDWPRYR